jgi:hypothetical protein
MAITPDQKATLQLLLERGQTYADLAKLLGQDESEVRARARGALTELGGVDPDRNVGLTDYLLGQADPIGRADASRHLREDPADRQLAALLSEALRAKFPAAELPRLPGEPRGGGGRRQRAASGAGSTAKSLLAGLSDSQSRLIAVVGLAAVVLLGVVLAVAGVFGGGGDDSTAATPPTTAEAPADEQIQRVPLRPVGGGNAQGEAVFGLASADQPFIDVAIEGLDPAPNDRTYVVWLMLTETEGYPLSPIAASENGTYQNRFSIPSAVLPIIARVRFVDVSIAPVEEIRRLVRDALQESALVLEEPGDVVLRGEIPSAAEQGGGDAGGGGGAGGGAGSGAEN